VTFMEVVVSANQAIASCSLATAIRALSLLPLPSAPAWDSLQPRQFSDLSLGDVLRDSGFARQWTTWQVGFLDLPKSLSPTER